MALGDSIEVDSGTYTPESMKLRRRLAETMLTQGTSTGPIGSPWQGVARLVQAMLGGYQVGELERKEKAQTEAGNSTLLSLLGGGAGVSGASSSPADASEMPSTAVAPSTARAEPAAAGDIDSVVNRLIGSESGGDPNAKNPASSATGLGQFIDSTWLATIKKHRPELAEGRSDAQLLALRSNANVSRDMTKAYAQDNAALLQNAGFSVTPGNIKLAHFAGPGGALKVLGADPTTPVTKLLTPAAIEANPFLRNMDAGQLTTWAARQMGGSGGPVRVAAANTTITDAQPATEAPAPAAQPASTSMPAPAAPSAAAVPPAAPAATATAPAALSEDQIVLEAWKRLGPRAPIVQAAIRGGNPQAKAAAIELIQNTVKTVRAEQPKPLTVEDRLDFANKAADLDKKRAETAKAASEMPKPLEEVAKQFAGGIEKFAAMPGEFGTEAFERAVGPLSASASQDSDPQGGFWGTGVSANSLGQMVARGIGEAKAVLFGGAAPTEVRDRIETSMKNLAAVMKPLVRKPGEGAWSDKDQDNLEKQIGGLTRARSVEEYRRRLNDLEENMQKIFQVPVKASKELPVRSASAPKTAEEEQTAFERVNSALPSDAQIIDWMNKNVLDVLRTGNATEREKQDALIQAMQAGGY